MQITFSILFYLLIYNERHSIPVRFSMFSNTKKQTDFCHSLIYYVRADKYK